MKVLHLIDTLDVGGAEKSLLEILSRFQRVQKVMCHIYSGRTLKPAYEQRCVPVISLDLTEKYAFGLAIRKVREVVQQEKPDLIHSTLFRADIVGRIVGRLTGIPVINSFVNDSYASVRKQSLSTLNQLKLNSVQLLDMLTVGWVDHFVAISETIKNSNCQKLHLSSKKVSVIYRGRDPDPFLQLLPQQVDQVRGPLKLSDQDCILLNVARLLERKGQADLIQAISLVVRKFPNIKLLIAGEGYFRIGLEQLIHELNLTDKVHLLGTRNDIPVLLHLADVFVFPSHYEGHGGALVEAMFAACPIVATDTPVHQESITHGETGLLVPMRDPEALAQGIIQMLQYRDKRQQIGDRAREVALKRFHIQEIAAQHEKLYEEILHQYSGSKIEVGDYRQR